MIHIAIVEDHQGIIDGYRYRMSGQPDIKVVADVHYGNEIERMLAKHKIDVLILDIQIPTDASDPNPYPVPIQIKRIIQLYPRLLILIISMHNLRSLIRSALEAGVSGYILKDDQVAIRDLPGIIRTIYHGGTYLSPHAYEQITRRPDDELNQELSPRQIEALSLCAAFPEASSFELARRMHVAHSTLRNILSGAYLKLQVPNRRAAVAKAQALGLIFPDELLRK
jgi:two-component system response regulator DesR